MEQQSIEMTAKFSNFKVINKDFTRCRCNVFYTGRNRNYTDITESALQKFIARKGYANVPVVAHLIKDDDGKYRVGGHDSKIIMSDEGIEVVDECVPFGVIPEDCNPSMDLVTELSGEERQYFSVDLILWTHRYPILEAAFSDEVYFNQSMEITIEDFTSDGNYTVINDFSLSALCLLNRSKNPEKNVEPCFESSRVRAFSVNESQFKKNFELMLNAIKQYEDDKMKGATIMNYSEIEEILSAVTFKNSKEAEVCKYRLLQVTDSKVYVLDMEDYKPYGFNYAVTKDNEKDVTVIDFESKAEISFLATEKTDDGAMDLGSIIESEIAMRTEEDVKCQLAEVEAAFNQKMDELKASYEELSASFAEVSAKLKEYQEAEQREKEQEHQKEIEELFTKYADKLGRCADFLVYRAKTNPKDVTVDEVQKELTLMVGKHMMDSSTKKNFSYQPTEAGIKTTSSMIESRYGHLLDKYLNN